MKYLFSILFACCLSLGGAVAQTTLSSKEMVAITPIVCDAAELPDLAKKALMVKMTQMVTMGGFGSTSVRYALTPNIVHVAKEATATVPVMYLIDLELSFYVVDIVENVIIGEVSVPIRGVDRTEARAYIKAINSFVPARSREVKQFMDNSREAILSYYKTRVPTLLQKADALAQREEYEEAMAVLSPIPESVEEYAMVSQALVAIHKKKLDRDAIKSIQAAKVLISKDNDQALEELMKVDPSSNYWGEANKMISQIKTQLAAAEKARIEKIEAAAKEAAELQRLEIEANAKIEVANVEATIALQKAKDESAQSGLVTFSKKVNSWFVGMFKPMTA